MSLYLLQWGITWKEFLMGGENWNFLAEALLRSIVMFAIIVLSLRILGKRGVKQLSVFELVVIIGLGSAAGDPMFYKDVGLLPALIVFTVVISLYKLLMYFIGKSKGFEKFIEGKSVCLISEGKFNIANFKKETLAQDEFFAELRIKGVSQLGQVELGIIEITGEISLFFYEDSEVKYGLPILPDPFEHKTVQLFEKRFYSCSFCGYTEELQPAKEHTCPVCRRNQWVVSINKKRVQ